MSLPRPVLPVVVALALAGGVLVSTGATAGTPDRGAPLSFRRTVLASQGSYGEPSLAVTKDGKHIAVCVPGGSGDKVWWSGDDGHTFGTTATDSTNGGGDCELDFLPDGTLLSADLEVYDSNVKTSKDFGRTFDAGQAVGIEQDRQWFAHSADGKTVYLAYHDFAAEGEFVARSTDGGKTWPAQDAAIPVNGADQVTAPGVASTPKRGMPASLLDQGVNTFSGPMLLSPDGKDQYVLYSISDAFSNATGGTPPFGPTRGIVVAHRAGGTGAFTDDYAVTNDDGGTVNGAIFPWGTIDRAGNVYVLYNSDKGSPGHFHTWYVFSSDKAKTWSDPVKVDGAPLAQGAQVYATGQAGAPGVLDVAWYGADAATGADDPKAVWDVHFAQVRGATSRHPQVDRSLIAPDPIHRGDICLNGLLCVAGGDRSLADFFELVIGPDGMAQVAYADNDGQPGGGRVVWAKQTGGRSALR
ncbi:MAG: hypothetical protein JWN17_37 [Frankiales bacterium]|nr:hypothetical protein [Frankiales bacterium]